MKTMSHSISRSTSVLGIAAALGLAWAASPAHAAPIIWGGPTYNSTTQTGYPSPTLPVVPGSTAGNGVAVGYAYKYESGSYKGQRAVRWDASGTAATELGHLGADSSGFTFSFAYAVNAAGTAVGYANKYESGSGKGDRAVRWDASGTAATELGNLGLSSSGGTYSVAYAVNAAGTAVGFAYKYESGSDKGIRAVRWDASGITAAELGNLGLSSSGSTISQAYAVNAVGTAVGYAYKYESGSLKGYRAVRWDASGTAATELGNLGLSSGGGTNSEALAINAAGTAVGYATKYESGSDKGTRAVRWDASGTAATELGHLGTDGSGVTYNYAWAVNAAGTAVGYAIKYESGSYMGNRAVRWDASGTAATELGNLGTDSSGVTASEAYAINAAGIAVGYANEYNLSGTYLGQRAVAWGLDGIAINLNTLLGVDDTGWVNLYQARGISDTGWITGTGTYDPDGPGGQAAYTRAFLLNATSLVPEPTSLSLLAIGGAALLRQSRKRSSR